MEKGKKWKKGKMFGKVKMLISENYKCKKVKCGEKVKCYLSIYTSPKH